MLYLASHNFVLHLPISLTQIYQTYRTHCASLQHTNMRSLATVAHFHLTLILNISNVANSVWNWAIRVPQQCIIEIFFGFLINVSFTTFLLLFRILEIAKQGAGVIGRKTKGVSWLVIQRDKPSNVNIERKPWMGPAECNKSDWFFTTESCSIYLQQRCSKMMTIQDMVCSSFTPRYLKVTPIIWMRLSGLDNQFC